MAEGVRALLRFARRLPDVRPWPLLAAAIAAAVANAVIVAILNAGANAPEGTAVRLRIAFLAALIVYWVMQRRLVTDSVRAIESALHRYRMEQIDRLCRSDLDAVERLGPAGIYGALTRYTQTISTAAGPIVLAAQSLLIVAAVLLYFVWVSRQAALVTLVILGVAFIVARRRWIGAYRRLQESRGEENALFDGITDLIEGFKEVRLHRGRGEDLEAFVASISSAVAAVRVDVDTRLIRLFLFAQTSFYVAAAAMVFLFPALDPTSGARAFQATTVILFLVGPVSAITGAATAVVKAAAAADGLLHLDEALRAAAGPGVTAAPLTTFSEIRLEDVTYQHRQEDDQPGFVVGPVSVTLRRGELVFIRGGNGSGKTTLVKLLTALYAPGSGALLVDGRPVGTAEREAYRGLYSAVFADFHLFHRPFGLEEVAPLHFARLLDEMELTGKTELVGGRFTTVALSSGQRKRLALITALLEDRPIYVFDEWAADQDPSFRRKFYDEILPALSARGKTLVVITHDERYIRPGHRVLSMEEGRLVAAGVGSP